jgi:hypothetical protein
MGRKLQVTSTVKCERTYKVEEAIDGTITLTLQWKGIDVMEERRALDVTALVSIKKGADLSAWRLEIENRSNVFGVYEYTFPYIEVSAPDPDLARNYLLTTFRTGELIRDPFYRTSDDERSRTLRKDYHREIRITADAKAGQFLALYGDNSQGFYYSSQDDRGWEKAFRLSIYPKTSTAGFTIKHVPLNLGYANQRTKMEYWVVAGAFSGDWYDACQLYRGWALKQPWCRKGTVADRIDIPAWLKDIAMVGRQDTRQDATVRLDTSMTHRGRQTEAVAKAFKGCTDFFGSGILSIWYNWWLKDKSRSAADLSVLRTKVNANDGQINLPVAGAKETNAAVTSSGGYPLMYLSAVLYDTGDSQDFKKAEKAAERDINGQIYRYREYPHACRLCRSSEWWQKRYAHIVRAGVSSLGFKGVYMDGFGKDGHRCFALNHGHSYGGGTKVVNGEHQFGEYVRKVMKEADPESVTSAEDSSEEFIDIVDVRLSAIEIYNNVVPIYSCIYHDYQLFYGRTISLDMEDPVFSMIAGYLFSIGGQLGRYPISQKGISPENSDQAKKLAYLKKLVLVKKAIPEFLNVGKMLRPPVIVTSMPKLSGKIW